MEKGNLFINKSKWNTFSEYEMSRYIADVFDYYRINGFPLFNTSKEFRDNEFRKLNNYDFRRCINNEEMVIGQSMHGLSLAWSYMPHSWNVRCGGRMTPMEAFLDDDIFMRVIRKRIKMGDNMSDNGIRKMLRMFSTVQSVSNFRPTAAASIYSLFTEPGDVVWDMSCGFGGRLLGSHLAEVKYIGTDPCVPTYNGLIKMSQDLKIKSNIHCTGSEDFLLPKNSVDFCFTSPPYFDLENYDYDLFQSFVKYSNVKDWLNNFLCQTAKNCHRCLKDGKVMAINIANTKKVPDLVSRTIEACEEAEFTFICEWRLALSNSVFKKGKNAFKYEPILVFEKH